MAGRRIWAWRWFFVGVSACVLGASLSEAQSRRRPPPRYLGINEPDQAAGTRILDDMRDLSLGGLWAYQEFELRILPRRGDERRLSGRMFAKRNATGPIARIEIVGAEAAPEVVLVQSGARPAVWRLTKSRDAAEITGAEAMQPLAGTNLSALDLQMPFMSWKDFIYEGREESAGRPAFVFLLYPPPTATDGYPGIGGVRVYLDTQFHVPTRIQWVDDAGQPLKTISVVSLMNVDDRHGVKSLDIRDDRTRDKTRLVFTAVALDVKLPEDLFSPAGPRGAAQIEIPAAELKSVR